MLEEKRRVQRFSWGAAAATGGFFVLALALYELYAVLTRNVAWLQADTERALILSLSVDLLITLVSLLAPFAVVYSIFRKRFHIRAINFGKSTVSFGDTLLFVVAGFGMMLVADYVTGALSTAFESATGAEFEYAFFNTPSTPVGIAVYVVRSALFPALVEEFAMRGVIMNALRRYGDWFAITMSAMVFALMHGNMVQAPFAFLAGFVLGYAAIKTGTIWTSIAIHFLNNGFSILYMLMADNGLQNAADYMSVAGTAIGVGLGAVCILVLLKRGRLTRVAPNRSFLPTGRCYVYFIFSPPMLLVLAYMIFQTALMVKL